MIVYDTHACDVRGADACGAWRAHLARAAATSDYDDLVTALVETGIFESACADALCPEAERSTPLLDTLRRASEAAGTALVSAWAGDWPGARAEVDRAVLLSREAESCGVPDALRLAVPEGYAFYGLYPETYADAAGAWCDAARPARVLCIGVRSIGTSLSGAVAGALRRRGVAVRSWTVRPRGHVFDREVVLGRDLVARLGLRDDFVLVVDEGPGLSGSSLAAAATAFSTLGVPDDRLVLVPSWSGDPARFVSAAARARWPRHAAAVPVFTHVRAALARADVVAAGAIEISAGAWREHLDVPQPWPAAHAQHERRKFVHRPEGWIARFAGLGTFGRRTLERAAALADAGWTAPPLGLRHGFLRQPFIAARPLESATTAFLTHAARYVAWLRRHASSSHGCARTAPLADMLAANAREALGGGGAAGVEALSRTAHAFSEPATAVDGRMMPHEWLGVDGTPRWIKADALDHHRDHFLPGCTDAAWDLAGLIVEHGLYGPGRAVLVEEYVRQSEDRSVAHRLPFFVAAYAALRTGYCAMAAATLAGSADAARFDALGGRYRAALRATLAASGP